MTKAEAQKQLIQGYILAGIGLIVGVILPNTSHNPKPVFAPLLFAYTFWATYWGVKIMYPLVKSYFDVPVGSMELWDAIAKRRTKMFWTLGVTLILGYFVGVFGGGIYKQVRLMAIK